MSNNTFLSIDNDFHNENETSFMKQIKTEFLLYLEKIFEDILTQKIEVQK